MTIGDVLAAIAAISLIAASWIGMLVFVILLAPDLARRAEKAAVNAPLRCGLIGLVAVMFIVIPCLSGLSALVGIHKLMPAAVLGLLASVAFVGSAGIVQHISSRIDLRHAPSTSLIRAASIYFLASIFPIAGWFVVTPVSVFISVGAGISAVIGGLNVPKQSQVPPVSVELAHEAR